MAPVLVFVEASPYIERYRDGMETNTFNVGYMAVPTRADDRVAAVALARASGAAAVVP